MHATGYRLVFPHEMHGLSAEEVRENKPQLARVIESLKGVAEPVKLRS